MAFIPLQVVPLSREYDGIFELTESSRKIADSFTPFRWQANRTLFFKGADTTVTFPLAMNLYLAACSAEELVLLLSRTHFLSMRMYYGDESGTISCISGQLLSFAGLRDPKYRDLLQTSNPNNVPCVIYTGALWHFMGMNRVMVSNRRLETGVIGIITTHPPEQTYFMGFEMYARDQYPNETEEQAKANEEADGIFIVRT